jgi:ABC-type sugar transport system substrate-binding protein
LSRASTPEQEVLRNRVLVAEQGLIGIPRSSQREEEARSLARARTRVLEFAWATFLVRGMEQGVLQKADPRLLTRATKGRGDNLAAVIKGLDNPFFATMRDGLVATAREHNFRITIYAAVGLQDTAGRVSATESLAAQQAACCVVNPIDQTNLIQPLAHVPRGTPIVNIDSSIDRRAATAVGVPITTYIGTDNAAAGRLAADSHNRRTIPALNGPPPSARPPPARAR